MPRIRPGHDTSADTSEVSPMDVSELLGVDGKAKIFDVESGRVFDGASMRDTYFARRQPRASASRTANASQPRSRRWDRFRISAIVAICMAGPPVGAGAFLYVFGPSPSKPLAVLEPSQTQSIEHETSATEQTRFQWVAASQASGAISIPLPSSSNHAPELPSLIAQPEHAVSATGVTGAASEEKSSGLIVSLSTAPQDGKVSALIPVAIEVERSESFNGFPNPKLNIGPVEKQAGSDLCPPATIQSSAMAGGRSRLKVLSPCRKEEAVTLKYAGLSNTGRLDENGQRDFVVDLFAGDHTVVEFIFADGSRTARLPISNDLVRLSKVAVVWRGPVNLDLHAFEYSSRIGGRGHIWAGSPSSFEIADAASGNRKGQGFLSSQSAGAEDGDHVEVYTFVIAEGQRTGVIETAIHYATRGAIPHGDTCDGRRHASVTFSVFLSSRGQLLEKVTRQFSSVPCGVALTGNRLLVRNSVQRLDRRQAALHVEP